jgi:hypothetical protein
MIRRAEGIQRGEETKILMEAIGGFNRPLKYLRLERVVGSERSIRRKSWMLVGSWERVLGIGSELDRSEVFRLGKIEPLMNANIR